MAESALELAAPASSILICDRLLELHDELTARYRGEAQVIPFREQLRDYMKRVAPQKDKGLVAT